MTVFAAIMAIVWLVAGIGVLSIGIKSGRGTLPKSTWAGIRTPILLSSDESWIKGHKAAARYISMSSIPLFVGSVLCLVGDDALIGGIGIPVAALAVAMLLVASRKAHCAVREAG
ncbi:SdpI family protein [Corynebacterium mastitidis]|uniref:SdpI family protein n=1 Tax=Corynebacterium mastitidis TaxID=161890 RepID=A0A2N0X5E5_9CORY|nr:SdpI family protein [Corynebacterium mastitidis]MCH6196698.1 SdpI family protein [Corynebacterium mastitidis]PKF67917.1 hypothetical protein CXB45_09810 [Corynebacterium mastitidis]